MKTELRELAVTFQGISEGKPWQLMPKAGGLWRDPIDTTPVQAIERNYKIRLKPWKLTDTVNGHTLPPGASWHRNDFDEDMLPPPYRPLVKGEIGEHDCRREGNPPVWIWESVGASPDYTSFCRTTRPIRKSGVIAGAIWPGNLAMICARRTLRFAACGHFKTNRHDRRPNPCVGRVPNLNRLAPDRNRHAVHRRKG